MWRWSALPRCVSITISVLLPIFGFWFLSHSWGHEVGEPELEKTPIWQKCCGNGDCVPKPVKVVNKAEQGNRLVVRIDGVEAAVGKEKFSPVPSNRTWVCYVLPNGTVTDENIRCILYPEKGGTT
jgi:hypothetical protein